VTKEEFEILVGKLDQLAKRNPAGYRARVLLVALLGNAYLGVMLLLIALLVAAAAISVVWLKGAGVKIAILMAVFLWLVLKALEQFKAVLAHEFGHLSKGHGRMANWIYRQRLRWSRLMTALEAAESWGVVLFGQARRTAIEGAKFTRA
jgi:hypothetical protein